MTRTEFKSNLPTDPEAIAALAESAGLKFDPEPVPKSVGERWAERIIRQSGKLIYIKTIVSELSASIVQIRKCPDEYYAQLNADLIRGYLAPWLDQLRDETLEEAASGADRFGRGGDAYQVATAIRAMKGGR